MIHFSDAMIRVCIIQAQEIIRVLHFRARVPPLGPVPEPVRVEQELRIITSSGEGVEEAQPVGPFDVVLDMVVRTTHHVFHLGFGGVREEEHVGFIF